MSKFTANCTFRELTCPICKRTFIKAPEHVFVQDGKTFCRWNCLCEYRHRKEEKKKKFLSQVRKKNDYGTEMRKKAVWMVVNDGMTPTQVSLELGCTDSCVSNWVRLYKRGGFEI